MIQETERAESSRPWHRWARLLAALIAAGIIWCGVLPSVATQPRVQQHLTFLDERGIDPSAMFYTELDVMDAILQKVDRSHSDSVGPANDSDDPNQID